MALKLPRIHPQDSFYGVHNQVYTRQVYWVEGFFVMNALKCLLWDRWGSQEFPAEWDGINYGGGKGSQRYWEYLWVVNQLDGTEHRILDVGAGPTLFLPKILEQGFQHVEAVDPTLRIEDDRHHRSDLRTWISNNEESVRRFDCVTCVSVVEHTPDPREIFKDLARFKQAKVIITLELGFDPPGFEYQLTLQKLYLGLNCFRDHYLSQMETCPVWADDSRGGYWRPFGMVLSPRPNG